MVVTTTTGDLIRGRQGKAALGLMGTSVVLGLNCHCLDARECPEPLTGCSKHAPTSQPQVLRTKYNISPCLVQYEELPCALE